MQITTEREPKITKIELTFEGCEAEMFVEGVRIIGGISNVSCTPRWQQFYEKLLAEIESQLNAPWEKEK